MSMELVEKLAVVTGGASGFGHYVVQELIQAGARVLVVDRAAHGHDDVLVADVTTEAGRASILDAGAALGGIDVLVNNAGGWTLGGSQFPEAEATAWRMALELNLLAPMALTQLCLLQMQGRGGAVVNVSSSAGMGRATYGSPEYATAKAGLIRFTTSTADWAGRFGVRVNCIVPGWIGLERAHAELAAMDDESRSAAGPIVSPESITREVLRLLRDDRLAGRVVTMLDDTEPVLLPST
jgi:NAD(P)-dependent dehydrogenase (short-subunit alcohol dehydrogenase family)